MLETLIILSLVCTVVLLFVTLFNEYYQQRLGVSCMPTTPKVRARMMELIEEYAKDGHANIVELGCGWGGMARNATKLFPWLTTTGIEKSLFPYLFSKLRAVGNDTNIRHENIYKYDLKNADIVLCYLSNQHMKNLENKMTDELKPGSVVISSTFQFSKKKPDKIVPLTGVYDTKIYIYVF